MRKEQETGDEILGKRISPAEKMRFIQTVNSLFGKGAEHEDLNLLRILHAGILQTEMLSPERSEYSLGDTGQTVVVRANGKKITVEADGNVATESAGLLEAALAGMPSLRGYPKPGGMD